MCVERYPRCQVEHKPGAFDMVIFWIACYYWAKFSICDRVQTSDGRCVREVGLNAPSWSSMRDQAATWQCDGPPVL